MFYCRYSPTVNQYECASKFPEVILNCQDEEFLFSKIVTFDISSDSVSYIVPNLISKTWGLDRIEKV